MHIIIRSIYIFFLLISVLFATDSYGGESLPDVSLTVATRFSENSAWGNEIDVLTLNCFEENCELITLVLNKCISLSDGEKVQTPFAYTTSTRSGVLQVHRVGNALHVEKFGGPSGITRKFIFEFIPGSLMATKLKSFSGAYVKNSDILGKTISAELIPLKGNYQIIEIDCPIELPGISKHND